MSSSESTHFNDAPIKKKYPFLYPLISDEDFNVKIAQKREFYDTKYPDEYIEDVETHGNFLCQEKEFELLPHQMFVRNFLSYLTPYNSLLLYHGLGTGKTCSAISVCEEARKYARHTNNSKKILIIASPNVKENFKLQLFDERKLKKVNGIWNLRACTGNKYLQEINPMNMKNLSKDRIIIEVRKIINGSYSFMGYNEFSNKIQKIINHYPKESVHNKLLKREFSNTLIVIDEVHNIRDSPDNPKKKVAINLLKVVKMADNLKLLLLSATPMYNNPQEIIWLLNVMLINDNRLPLDKSKIFNTRGTFIIGPEGDEIGKKELAAKSIGYISYLRGQNPYTFPYRIWPEIFKSQNSLLDLMKKHKHYYPKKQINNSDILNPIKYLDLFMVKMKPYQEKKYQQVIENIKKRNPKIVKEKLGMGYEILDYALQSLNIVFPNKEKDGDTLYGNKGLEASMNYNTKLQQFSYKNYLKKKRFLSPKYLSNYSSKISHIIKSIKKSKGIVLIYSQYLAAGCIPIALALEEIGFNRFGRKNLFKKRPTSPIHYKTMKHKKKVDDSFYAAQYAMITGNIHLSSKKNKVEMKAITNPNNEDGKYIKVVIITKAGAEGLDFKNIRQVHILEPWYNLNRVEQVIGRAVRNCSHKNLPFVERNVEIYLYGTYLKKKNNESADLYVYRKAEDKSIKIGDVSRLLKKNAIDCLLNSNYNNISINKDITQIISSKSRPIEFNIQSRPYSTLCDFKKECQYSCSPTQTITSINDDTYNEEFIIMNMDKIIQRIRTLMKEQFIYKRDGLINRIRANKEYPLMQIDLALNKLVNDHNIFITDMFNRIGYLVNIGEYYMFQPLELPNKQITRYERAHPLDYKRDEILIKTPPTKAKSIKPQENILEKLEENIICITSTKKCKECISIIEKSLPKVAKRRPKGHSHTALSDTILLLSNPPFNIPMTKLKIFVYEHLFDKLSYNDKLFIIRSLWERKKLSTILKNLKKILTKNFTLKLNKIQLIFPIIHENSIVKGNKQVILIYESGEWKKATTTDLIDNDYDTVLSERFEEDNLSEVFGFMGNDKKYNIIFKVIKSYQRGQKFKSAQCITQQKNKIRTLLNELMNIGPISTFNKISFVGDESGTPNINNIVSGRKDGFTREKLCFIEEFILRYYQIKDKSKSWFLSFFEAKYNKIEK